MGRDDATFLKLVEDNRPRIRRLCRAYARSAADREDLYQEIVFQLWRAMPSFRADSRVNTWLYRVAVNTAVTHVRKQAGGRKRVVADTQRVEAAPDTAHTHSNEDLESLYAAIAQLDATEKAVVTLFLEQLSYEEMAGVLGISANHAGVLLHRTRKKLLALMRREEVSP